MSRQLWRPVTEAEGVPFDVVKTFWNAFNDWRTDFLSVVGVPTNFEGEWDFVSVRVVQIYFDQHLISLQAVSSCASDATYHIMWIILFSALDEFGIKEVNDAVRMGTPPTTVANQVEIETLARKIADEALHGALRIAGLVRVLSPLLLISKLRCMVRLASWPLMGTWSVTLLTFNSFCADT